MSEANIFELKERAKWSRDTAEKKNAITELAAHGDRAIPALDEIQAVTTYEDIKAACMEAIKAIEGKSTVTTDQKKEKELGGAEVRLADLPP